MLAALGAVALTVASATPASALPAQPQALIGAANATDLVTEAQWRGRRGHRGHHRHYRRGRGGGAALGIGLATGAIIGGALAAQSRTYDRSVEYCMQRFKSYDPGSGTYLGYDGYRHPCP